jgi:hypothetical protein
VALSIVTGLVVSLGSKWGLVRYRCLAAFMAALRVATVLSVVKPWGRTRWGEPAARRGDSPAPHARPASYPGGTRTPRSRSRECGEWPRPTSLLCIGSGGR